MKEEALIIGDARKGLERGKLTDKIFGNGHAVLSSRGRTGAIWNKLDLDLDFDLTRLDPVT